MVQCFRFAKRALHYDEPELPEHEVQEPEDARKKGKPCLVLSRQDLLMTRSVKTHFTMLVSVSQDTICQDTFHDACFCHTLHVNFSGSGDRVRGARFCRHLHSAFFSDRVYGVRTCCLLCSD